MLCGLISPGVISAGWFVAFLWKPGVTPCYQTAPAFNLKTYLTAILLFCFLTPVAMTSVLVSLQFQKLTYSEGWRRVADKDRDELMLFKFSKAEEDSFLEWKNPMEFKYKGEMYDIVEKEVHGDTTHYYVWWDREETKMLKNLYKFISITRYNADITFIVSNIYFKSLYYSEYSAKLANPLFRLVQYPSHCARLYKSVVFTPPSPPPKSFTPFY